MIVVNNDVDLEVLDTCIVIFCWVVVNELGHRSSVDVSILKNEM